MSTNLKLERASDKRLTKILNKEHKQHLPKILLKALLTFLEKNHFGRQTALKTAHVGKIFNSFIIFLHISKTGFTTLFYLKSSKDKHSRKIAGKKPTLMHIEI